MNAPIAGPGVRDPGVRAVAASPGAPRIGPAMVPGERRAAAAREAASHEVARRAREASVLRGVEHLAYDAVEPEQSTHTNAVRVAVVSGQISAIESVPPGVIQNILAYLSLKSVVAYSECSRTARSQAQGAQLSDPAVAAAAGRSVPPDALLIGRLLS